MLLETFCSFVIHAICTLLTGLMKNLLETLENWESFPPRTICIIRYHEIICSETNLANNKQKDAFPTDIYATLI